MASQESRKWHQPATDSTLISVVHGEYLLFSDVIKWQLVTLVDPKPPAHCSGTFSGSYLKAFLCLVLTLYEN